MDNALAIEPNAPENEPEVKIGVDFDGKRYTLGANEAAELARMGMQYRQIMPSVEKARFIAARDNLSLDEFIDAVYRVRDKKLRADIAEKVGDDEELINLLMEQKNLKAKGEYENMLKAQQDCESRGKKQLEADKNASRELIGKYFGYKSESDIPDTAKRIASENNISLFDALLRYDIEQRRIRESEFEARQRADMCSTGTQQSIPENTATAEFSALMRGISGK